MKRNRAAACLAPGMAPDGSAGRHQTSAARRAMAKRFHRPRGSRAGAYRRATSASLER